MNDKIVFGQYINKNSWIHRLDPRCKVITLFMMMIGIFLITNVHALLVCLGFIFIVVLTTKISPLKFLKSFRMIAMLLIFTAFFQIAFNTTGDIIQIKGYELKCDFTLTWINLSLSVLLLILLLSFSYITTNIINILGIFIT